MVRKQKLAIIILRVAVGWFFLHQGIVGITDPAWSIVPQIQNAQTFTTFYQGLSGESAPFVNYLFKGLFLIVGTCLVLGLFARLAALLGVLMMLFFFLPTFHFPYAGPHYLVDERVIVMLTLLYLYAVRAGEYFGMGSMFHFSRY